VTGLPSGVSVSPLTLQAGSSGTLNLNASASAGQEGFSATAVALTSWTAPVTVVGAAGSVQAKSQLALTISTSNPSFSPAAAAINLPIVNINTGGVGIVSKTTDVPGTITITSADGKTLYLPNASDSDNTATFHVHGNSTALMPKLPYHVKLNTSLDLLYTMGLTCPYVTSSGKPACDKSKSYILLANYDDKTLLRDWAASALANAIPLGNGYLNSPSNSPSPSGTSTLMPWAPHSLFVELYLNGVYEGNYQLIEEVKVDSHRVNINELSESNTSQSKITGGYLMEIDQRQDEAFVFITPQGVPIGLIDPDFTPDPEVPAQTTYISNYMDTAETALFSSNFTDPTNGWRAYFDEASAINFYIVNDVMGNVDGGALFSSDYLYKDQNNPLIYMGPIWDFDISAGNVNYQPIVNPTVPWMQTNASWYVQWFKDPSFKADVVTQWNALKNNGVFSTWLASVQQQSKNLEQSQVNNFGRWPMVGIEVWPNTEAAGSYDGEVGYLLNWLNLRIGYLDSLFNNKAQTYISLDNVAGKLQSGGPITLTAQVTGGASPTGVVSFLSNGVVLGTGAVGGSGSASFAASNLPIGANTLQAVYNGDSNNALSVSVVQPVAISAPVATTAISIADPVAVVGQGSSNGLTALVIGNAGTVIPTGSVTFCADSGAETLLGLDYNGEASYSTSSLKAGTHTVTANYSGDANYAPSSTTLMVNVVGAATPSFSLAGGTYTSVQTLTISDATTGAAIYYTTDGGAPTTNSSLYTGPIAIHSSETIQAIATGGGFAGSPMATASYAINLPVADFSLSVFLPSLSVVSGQSVTNIISVIPQNGFAGAISLTCSGLPAGTTCVFSPVSVASSGVTEVSTLTISTSAAVNAKGKNRSGTLFPGAMLAAVLCNLGWRKRRNIQVLLVLTVALFGLGWLTGCGTSSSSRSNAGTQPTTSTVTVTAKAGKLQHATTFSLTVR
jgi:hypothetical protein